MKLQIVVILIGVIAAFTANAEDSANKTEVFIVTPDERSCEMACAILYDSGYLILDGRCGNLGGQCDEGYGRKIACDSGWPCSREGRPRSCKGLNGPGASGFYPCKSKVVREFIENEDVGTVCAELRSEGLSAEGCPQKDKWCEEGYWLSEACSIGDGICNKKQVNC